MARIGQYGWNPRQMDRINARRMERGQEPLVNLRNIKTEQDYTNAQNLIASSKEKRNPVTMQDNQNSIEKLSMEKEAEERTKKFREKFGPAGSMGIERGVKSSFPSILKKGVQGGIGTSLQDSLYRFTA